MQQQNLSLPTSSYIEYQHLCLETNNMCKIKVPIFKTCFFSSIIAHKCSTMNIFGSKSSHLNKCKNGKIFFIFPQYLLYLKIFKSFAAHLALSSLKNHQILQNFWIKIFKLFYFLCGYFWNQKCSQCIRAQ